eukprot:3629931-Amphidinium_carterae.1
MIIIICYCPAPAVEEGFSRVAILHVPLEYVCAASVKPFTTVDLELVVPPDAQSAINFIAAASQVKLESVSPELFVRSEPWRKAITVSKCRIIDTASAKSLWEITLDVKLMRWKRVVGRSFSLAEASAVWGKGLSPAMRHGVLQGTKLRTLHDRPKGLKLLRRLTASNNLSVMLTKTASHNACSTITPRASCPEPRSGCKFELGIGSRTT